MTKNDELIALIRNLEAAADVLPDPDKKDANAKIGELRTKFFAMAPDDISTIMRAPSYVAFDTVRRKVENANDPAMPHLDRFRLIEDGISFVTKALSGTHGTGDDWDK